LLGVEFKQEFPEDVLILRRGEVVSPLIGRILS
jgi:hypothetical protein